VVSGGFQFSVRYVWYGTAVVHSSHDERPLTDENQIASSAVVVVVVGWCSGFFRVSKFQNCVATTTLLAFFSKLKHFELTNLLLLK